MDLANGVLWPLATGPDKTRWAVQAAELYVNFTPFVMRHTTLGMDPAACPDNRGRLRRGQRTPPRA